MKSNKTISSKSGSFAVGGNGKMRGKMGVQPSKPGVSAPPSAPSPGNNFPKGGNGHMAGKQTVKPSKVR